MPVGGDDVPRFWAKVAKTDDGSCWNWLGGKDHGYGKAWFHGRNWRAHRVAYELIRGPIPEGLSLDHLCRNKLCVNPAHLEAVTHRTNVLRGTSPAAICAARDVCGRGHSNWRFSADGRRLFCRSCRSMSRAARRRERERSVEA